MILAAGRGTRLAGVEPGIPKPLVQVRGRPVLEWQLRYLAANGVDEVVVNAHHLAEQIEEFAARREGAPELTVVTEPRLLGTAGGVRNALDLLGPDRFVVLYGDVLLDEPLAPLVRRHDESGAALTIWVHEARDTTGKGVVLMKDGWVTAFVEKGGGSGPGWVNAGIYLVEPEVMARLPPGAELDFGLDVLPGVAREGRLAAVALASPVIEMGTPEGLSSARGP
jgi:NDP-sugar pyrophosphorylase family protein